MVFALLIVDIRRCRHVPANDRRRSKMAIIDDSDEARCWEEVTGNAIPNTTADCLPAALCRMLDAQTATVEGASNQDESFGQNTFRLGPVSIDRKEGRPWSPPVEEQSLAAFREHLREAEALEKQIAEIETPADQLLADAKRDLAPLEKSQIATCLRAWQLVADGQVAASVMDQYAIDAGEKRTVTRKSRAHG
jgi:hypothetical protein